MKYSPIIFILLHNFCYLILKQSKNRAPMNKLFHFATTLVFVSLVGNAYSHSTHFTPPDSTTNILDKTAAAYIIEEGKTLYGEGKIKDALIKFRQAGVKDPNSWRAAYWISQCHYKLNNFGYSLKYAYKAIGIGKEKVNKEIYYTLAVAQHRLGKLDSAIINYRLSIEKLSKMRSNILRIDHHINECLFAKEEMKNEPKCEKIRLTGDINSGYDDYNALYTGEKDVLYFTSRRSNTIGGNMNPDDQRYFEDVYRTKWDPIMKEWDDVTNKLGKINSAGFDALNFIAPDGNSGVVTLNSTATDARITTRGSDICEIKRNSKGDWNHPKAIKNKSINTSFFEGAATLTADGNTMYFVTDRKGQKSSTDIYVVHKNGKSWGTAEPLPMTINTKSRETTPFITPDGRFLFFASDGHLGMGGLDIYVVENKGDSWGEPINLGYGINSVTNDSHFSYNKELNQALISGFEIVGNKASLDIYEIDLTGFEHGEVRFPY